MSRQLWSVSALVRYLKSEIDGNAILNHVLVKGEISNFTAHRSGHYYFTLKDASSRMSCIMFASYTHKVRFPIKEGCKVIAAAKVSLYEAGGALQLYVMDMQLDGLGDLYLQLEETKKKLYAEGLFDESRKKPLPAYPNDIAFLSAKEGAATQDVLTTLKRRWPLARVTFYPTTVQGAGADAEIIKTLQKADAMHHDVILVVRGGGSIEDLWCFNSEALARCVSQCITPIVSGVGHETDTTLIDYVSDKRAPTPTAAAELVTPQINEVIHQLNTMKKRMEQALNTRIRSEKMRLDRIKAHHWITDPLSYILSDVMQLDIQREKLLHFYDTVKKEEMQLMHFQKQLSALALSIYDKNQADIAQSKQLLETQMQYVFHFARKQLSHQALLLDAFSPLKILSRGYTLSFADEHLIKSVEEVSVGSILTTQVSDGRITSQILSKENDDGTGKNI